MTILFDIGNVLLPLDFPSCLRTIFGPDYSQEDATSLWEANRGYEKGEMSDEEFIERARYAGPEPLSPEVFTAAWNGIFSPHPPMWELVRQLKKDGHTLITFSNTNALHARSFLVEFPVFEHFDHHHFSHEVGAHKPEAAFYQAAIERFGLTPSETIYFDDLADNITGGEKAGFLCHEYRLDEHEAALTWLHSVLR